WVDTRLAMRNDAAGFVVLLRTDARRRHLLTNARRRRPNGARAGLTLGLAPAICATLLMATHAAYSVWTGTYNLGTMLLVPVSAASAVLESGLLTHASRARAPLPATHYRAVYLLLFCFYAGLNFQALLYHLRDANWTAGHTPALMFTSSYLSRFYMCFRAWE